MIRINDDLLKQLIQKAGSSPRKRMNHNFHSSSGDTFQRMLNAMEPGTYIRPHKHENPDKSEAFIILRGTVCLVEFDDNGLIIGYIIMNADKGDYGAEISERSWHSLISLESGSVVYEVKHGPYVPETDKKFAGWAPEEGSPESDIYLQRLIRKLKLCVV